MICLFTERLGKIDTRDSESRCRMEWAESFRLGSQVDVPIAQPLAHRSRTLSSFTVSPDSNLWCIVPPRTLIKPPRISRILARSRLSPASPARRSQQWLLIAQSVVHSYSTPRFFHCRHARDSCTLLNFYYLLIAQLPYVFTNNPDPSNKFSTTDSAYQESQIGIWSLLLTLRWNIENLGTFVEHPCSEFCLNIIDLFWKILNTRT